MEIDKSKKYEIIVFPNQDEGLKAQRVLVSKGADFKHISTLAVVVPEERSQEACLAIIKGNALIGSIRRCVMKRPAFWARCVHCCEGDGYERRDC